MLGKDAIGDSGAQVGEVLRGYGFMCLHFGICLSIGSIHHLEVGAPVVILLCVGVVVDHEGQS